MGALGSLSFGEFVRWKARQAFAKARRILRTAEDGSFGSRVARVISTRLGRRAAPN